MSLFATGIALGLIVSIPPGPNAAVCVSLACDGTRRALPLIAGAALTDGLYALLAASGVLLAGAAAAGLLTYLAPFFLLCTAIAYWSPGAHADKAAVGVAVLNPATAAIWVGLSSQPVLRDGSTLDLLLRPVPVAIGTAVWFSLLAVIAARVTLRIGARQAAYAQKLLSVLLGSSALISTLALLAH